MKTWASTGFPVVVVEMVGGGAVSWSRLPELQRHVPEASVRAADGVSQPRSGRAGRPTGTPVPHQSRGVSPPCHLPTHWISDFLHSEMVLVPEGRRLGGSLATQGAAVGEGPGLGGGEGAPSPAVLLQPVVGLGRVCPRSPVSEHWLSFPIQAPAGVRAAQGE